ncbi:GTP cyclohydrolase II RibA [Methylobacterium terricola]|uniref:GTP cyclohydrolase-2 n=1 Tax=Methylobacterium terricola TaxID=2583531 RepID=A0A5C4LHM4_9HYPH|nr:GTP cyclohydrolase II RibA [Methylobacterium terricola]TNC11462.1 GTP cyclohydrolase II RibA [Methylobacterium terricola]
MQSSSSLDPVAGREQGQAQIDVERALAEIRAGRPVALRGGDPVLALSAEALDAATAATLSALAGAGARLVLPAPRLRRLGLADRTEAGAVALPTLDPARIETLALRLDGRIDAPVAPASAGDAAALALMALAQVLPAVIVVPGEAAPPGSLAVTADAVFAYPRRQAAGLRPVSRAPVPLASAPDSEFVVFRGGEGLRDQVAVVIGRPDFSGPVAVRLHSACLTGDLFGSLKCDCGDQLRGTAGWMAQSGGGIVLYLDQEGRGNGLANKIRAYDLQARGLDTYEADEALGFGLDQRRFDFAAAMLKALGVTSVRLLSNNPEKAASLEAAGLTVVETQRALGRVTPENIRYLTAKRDRAGHALDLDAFACLDV